ncbi:MAG: Crp/Fnr family transcriptional regulator [Helicobacteraceae bacterium]|jgi:CRP/FNR family transcriptional regulator|nr:Crp/Fnr family transcriptional regulator [Helicobacteraceae bacterium]
MKKHGGTFMSSIETMRTCPLFLSLGELDRTALLSLLKPKKLHSGEILFYENETMDRIYFLVHGRVKSYKVNRFDNEIFLFWQNESGLITLYSPRSEETVLRYFSNVESIGDSLVAYADRSRLDALCEENREIEHFLYKMFAERFFLLKHIISRDLVYDSAAKVANMIVTRLDDFNAYKKQEIAYMLNIQPETLSRILTKIKREGIIEEKGGVTTIKDRDKLRAIYET